MGTLIGKTAANKTARYREIVKQLLEQYVPIRYANGEIENEAVFDADHDRYLVVSVGWQGYHRVEHNLIHLDIIDGKIWIQKDGTEDGIADELEAAGVPKSDIVLAFQPLENRILIPDYAVS